MACRRELGAHFPVDRRQTPERGSHHLEEPRMRPYVKLAMQAATCAVLMLFGYGERQASAQTFPDKPVRLVIPFPPGGSNDVLGRYLGVKLSDRLGHQVVIDNRGGANGIIGADLVAQSTPDGYTLLMVSTSWVMNAAVRKLPYDVEKSFDPIATIGSILHSIVVDANWGVSTIQELVRRAKAKPA